jgi:hypothetical protein
MMRLYQMPRRGIVRFEVTGGHAEHRVEVVGETRTRYRVRAIDTFRPQHWLLEGEECLIRKRDVRFVEVKP